MAFKGGIIEEIIENDIVNASPMLHGGVRCVHAADGFLCRQKRRELEEVEDLIGNEKCTEYQ